MQAIASTPKSAQQPRVRPTLRIREIFKLPDAAQLYSSRKVAVLKTQVQTMGQKLLESVKSLLDTFAKVAEQR